MVFVHLIDKHNCLIRNRKHRFKWDISVHRRLMSPVLGYLCISSPHFRHAIRPINRAQSTFVRIKYSIWETTQLSTITRPARSWKSPRRLNVTSHSILWFLRWCHYNQTDNCERFEFLCNHLFQWCSNSLSHTNSVSSFSGDPVCVSPSISVFLQSRRLSDVWVFPFLKGRALWFS
jgi:hypothetical protein